MNLEEARAARRAAEASGDTDAWVHARVVEEGFRDKLNKLNSVMQVSPGQGYSANAPRFARGRHASGGVHVFDAARHAHGRDGRFINMLHDMSPGEKVHLANTGEKIGNEITVTKMHAGTYRIEGGTLGTSDHKKVVLPSAALAGQHALDRHDAAETYEHLAELKPGEHHVVRHQDTTAAGVVVHKTTDGQLAVLPFDVPGEKKKLGKLVKTKNPEEATKIARSRGREAGVLKAATPRDVLAQQGLVGIPSHLPGSTEKHREQFEKLNPDDAFGDLVPEVGAEMVAQTDIGSAAPGIHADSITTRMAERQAEGKHDPGVGDSSHAAHAVGAHADSAVHHVASALHAAAPHVPHEAHAKALHAATHVIGHADKIVHHGHAVVHVLHTLFSARYDEARAARIAAEISGDTRAWVYARAIEESALRALQTFDPEKHPRGRGGKWTPGVKHYDPKTGPSKAEQATNFATMHGKPWAKPSLGPSRLVAGDSKPPAVRAQERVQAMGQGEKLTTRSGIVIERRQADDVSHGNFVTGEVSPAFELTLPHGYSGEGGPVKVIKPSAVDVVSSLKDDDLAALADPGKATPA